MFSWRFFSGDLDRDLPAEEIAGVEWCSDAFVSLLEELKIVLSSLPVKIVWRRSSLHPPKTNLAGNRDGARLYFPLSSTFLCCCNFQIFALERTLSGCLLSISFDFTPFPVKLISAQTGVRMYTCRCFSPNGVDPMEAVILTHTHTHTHTHTLSLSLSLISLFILLVCLSFYWLLAGVAKVLFIYLFYVNYLFIYLLCLV